MPRVQKWITAGVLLIASLSQGADSNLIASGGENRVQLVELYSSESCSSCPPAESWVSTLQNRPGLWKSFVPIVFHVDYWNHLGWKDSLSSDLMTKRQVALSKLWAEPSVYTPAVVIDGHEWLDWRREHSLFPSPDSTKITLKLFKSQNGSYRVEVSGLENQKRYTVRLALLGMGLIAHVTGGENSGRVLKHDFVVLDWSGKDLSAQSPSASFVLKVPDQKSSRLAVAAWIEEAGHPTPLQSTGSFL